jgi:hypothetical protein
VDSRHDIVMWWKERRDQQLNIYEGASGVISNCGIVWTPPSLAWSIWWGSGHRDDDASRAGLARRGKCSSFNFSMCMYMHTSTP